MAWALLLLIWAFALPAAEVIPPVPQNHFNDEAHVVSPEIAQQLNGKLAQFERDTSDQVVVAVYPKMQTDSSIEDYTQRVAQKWGVGLKNKNNGVVLFVFIEDRKMFIQVGYGLEGVLPDALAKRIIEDEIKPQFKAGDYSAGLTAGVDAILKAIQREYKGTGHTVREQSNSGIPAGFVWFVLFIIAVAVVLMLSAHRPTVYTRQGRSSGWWGGWGDGGGWGGGWSGGSSGGSFSSGGGSFGGGGAGGSW